MLGVPFSFFPDWLSRPPPAVSAFPRENRVGLLFSLSRFSSIATETSAGGPNRPSGGGVVLGKFPLPRPERPLSVVPRQGFLTLALFFFPNDGVCHHKDSHAPKQTTNRSIPPRSLSFFFFPRKRFSSGKKFFPMKERSVPPHNSGSLPTPGQPPPARPP